MTLLHLLTSYERRILPETVFTNRDFCPREENSALGKQFMIIIHECISALILCLKSVVSDNSSALTGFHTGFFAGGGEVIVKVVVVYVSY